MVISAGPILLRKLLRDLWARKTPLAVIIAIVAIGTGSLIMNASIYRDLKFARDDYYREFRLADLSVSLKRAPESAVRLVEQTPGVAEARGRVVLPALLDLPNQSEPITGLVISMPETNEPILNDLLLREGTWFSGPEQAEAILNHRFAEANGFVAGDRIKVLLLDEQHDVLVVGTAMSPEYVYLIPTDGGVAPDPARTGIIYMPIKFLQRSGDLEGAFNQIVARTFDSSPAALDRVLNVIEDRLDAWGVTDATPRRNFPSVSFLDSEIQGIRASTTIMPTIFLGVAMLILNVVIGRMVAQQRSVIGTLKALGKSTTAIALHYLCFGTFAALLGAAGGVVLAYWLQGGMIAMYRQFYKLPNLEARFYPELYVLGVSVCLIAAAVGTIAAARRAASLHPAEAMRPPPPEKGGSIILERIPIFWSRLSFRRRLVLRAIFRNPFRSGVNFFTTLLATALLITTFSMRDSLTYLMEYQFSALSHEDLSVSLREPVGESGSREILSMPSIATVEPQLNVVCDLSNGPFSRRLAISGLPRGNRLSTPLDDLGQPVPIPDEGLVLTDKVARLLDVEVGDSVSLRPLIGERRRVQAPVIAIVKTYIGLSAYADIQYLSRLIGEDYVANSLLATSFGSEGWNLLYNELKKRPGVIGVARRERALEQMEGTMGETQGRVIVILVMFSGLIAFGSVLNTALVSLSEREREVGTFRVLGYTKGEVAAILRGEQIILSVMGTSVGMFAGTGLALLISKAYDTDLFRFPATILPIRYFHAALLMVLFVALAQAVVRVYIHKINWLDALKIKE